MQPAELIHITQAGAFLYRFYRILPFIYNFIGFFKKILMAIDSSHISTNLATLIIHDYNSFKTARIVYFMAISLDHTSKHFYSVTFGPFSH